MEKCVTNARFHGLPTYLEATLSCHQCKNDYHIPFVALALVKVNETVDTTTEKSTFSTESTYATNGDPLITINPELRGIRDFKIERKFLDDVTDSTFCSPYK